MVISFVWGVTDAVFFVGQVFVAKDLVGGWLPIREPATVSRDCGQQPHPHYTFLLIPK